MELSTALALFSNFFLDDLESLILNLSPAVRNIKFWYHYVDDIACLWTGSSRQLHNFLHSINSLKPFIQFFVEIKENKCLNVLDLSISHATRKFPFNIFRKPTYTNTIIQYESSRSYNQKMSAFRSMINRALSIPLSPQIIQSEILIIKAIVTNNGYDKKVVNNLLKKASSKLISQKL